jgi:molecular chaperone HtpG
VEFWNNYGEVVKEGLCEPSLEEKEEILEICRFNSTDSESLTSLDEYISRMADDQEDIFYLTGEDINKLRSHPRLEGFKKRNIEVLLLPEYVDDFWVNVINQYKGKSLQNASNTSVDLDKIQKMDTDNSNDNVKINEQELIGRFKQELGANIKDVIISKKLIDSPSCLALGEGNMSLRMEKMLIEQKQLKSESAKILEINIKHPIIQKIANSNDKNEYDDLIWLTFDQACILEGEKPKDPTKFVERINQLIS